MFQRILCLFTLFASLCLFASEVQYAWVEMGPNGAIARAISNGNKCVSIEVDGKSYPMSQRNPYALEGFPVMTCTFDIPATATSVRVGDWALPLPVKNPQKILIFGDTGCRIKGSTVQNCNGKGEGQAWSFAKVAATAAKMNPDLILHVGDYIYRESPCPEGNVGCEGSPYGDNWPTWQADFFHPVGPLLDTAPWVFTRGNHEDCKRAWLGYFLFLDPMPATADTFTNCPQHPDPYLVDAGSANVAVFDTANIPHAYTYPPDEKMVDIYAGQLDQINAMAAKGETWTITHRPFWAASTYMDGNTEKMSAVDYTLQAAVPKTKEGKLNQNIRLNLAGHVHQFEYLTFDDGRPPQIVSGAGGTLLDPPFSDELIQANAKVFTDFLKTDPKKNFYAFDDFAFLMLEVQPKEWVMKLYDDDGKLIKTYTLVR